METKKMISIMSLVMMIGIIAGAISFCITGDINPTVDSFAISAKNINTIEIIKNSFLPSFVMLAVMFILGFCALGQPLAFAVLFYRGIELGMAGAYTYETFGAKGFIIILLLILPEALLTSIIIVMGAREVLRFAGDITKFVVSDKCCDGIRTHTKLYLIRFAVLTGFLLVSSVIVTIINSVCRNFLF